MSVETDTGKVESVRTRPRASSSVLSYTLCEGHSLRVARASGARFSAVPDSIKGP